MSEYLPFWPKAAAGAYVGAAGSGYIFSRALPTNGFTEVVLQLQVDADFAPSANSDVQVTPQTSNDGINWADQTSATFKIVGLGTFPKQITEKFTSIAAFMRMKIHIHNGEGGALYLAPTVMVAGAGRS